MNLRLLKSAIQGGKSRATASSPPRSGHDVVVDVPAKLRQCDEEAPNLTVALRLQDDHICRAPEQVDLGGEHIERLGLLSHWVRADNQSHKVLPWSLGPRDVTDHPADKRHGSPPFPVRRRHDGTRATHIPPVHATCGGAGRSLAWGDWGRWGGEGWGRQCRRVPS